MLNRGGRYQDFAKAYKGELVANQYGKQINLYQEKTATRINTMTGKPFVGYAMYIPAGLSSTGEEIKDEGYDLHLITYKEITMTKARTISNYWLTGRAAGGLRADEQGRRRSAGPEAWRLGRLLSASNPDGVWDVKGGGTCR